MHMYGSQHANLSSYVTREKSCVRIVPQSWGVGYSCLENMALKNGISGGVPKMLPSWGAS